GGPRSSHRRGSIRHRQGDAPALRAFPVSIHSVFDTKTYTLEKKYASCSEPGARNVLSLRASITWQAPCSRTPWRSVRRAELVVRRQREETGNAAVAPGRSAYLTADPGHERSNGHQARRPRPRSSGVEAVAGAPFPRARNGPPFALGLGPS